MVVNRDGLDADPAKLPDRAALILDALIHEKDLSQKDSDICRNFDIEAVATEPEHEPMRQLHEVLRAKYGADVASGAA